MKKVSSLIVLLSILFIAGCATAEPEELFEASSEVKEEASDFVKMYKESMVDAVNERSFNLIEPLIIKNTSFYHSIRRYIEDLTGKGAEKELKSLTIGDIYEDEIGDVYVDVNEEVVIYNFGEIEEEHIDRNVQYHLNYHDDSYRIVNIKILD